MEMMNFLIGELEEKQFENLFESPTKYLNVSLFCNIPKIKTTKSSFIVQHIRHDLSDDK